MNTIRRLEDINIGEYVMVAKPEKNLPIHWPLIFVGKGRATRLSSKRGTEEFGEPFIRTIEETDNPNLIHYISYSTTNGEVDGSYGSGIVDKKHPKFNEFKKILEEAE